MNDVNERLTLFRELVTCTHNLTFSMFNQNYENIFCNSDIAGALYLFLAIDDFDTLNQLPTLASKRSADHVERTAPVICNNSLGMFWISECEYSEHILKRIHVLGPVFTTDYSLQNISQRIDSLNIPFAMKKDFLKFVQALPIIPLMHMHEYGCMLHYCLYQEKIAIGDLLYMDSGRQMDFNDTLFEAVAPEQTYLATKNLLDMIESGNLEYQKSVQRLSTLGYLSNHSNDFLRQAKTAMVTLTALCCHAAIRGGLTPSTAYLLSDHYLQEIEVCSQISSIADLGNEMLLDYTQRVHRIRQLSSSVSPQIQIVCDRISLNPEITPDIASLASELGYSECYFSRKFHLETGVTVKEYLRKEKIKKAKALLQTTNLSVVVISEKLGFCSPSYFGKLFKQSTGMSPGDFRLQIKS